MQSTESKAGTSFDLGGFLFAEEPAPVEAPKPVEPGLPDPPTDPADPAPPPTAEAPPAPAAGNAPPAPSEDSTNVWFNLAKSFQVTDKLLPDDLEIPADIDGPRLKALLKEAARKEALAETDLEAEKKAAREAEWKALYDKGWTKEQIEEARRVSEGLVSGIDPAVAGQIDYLTAMAEYEPQTLEHKLEYVRRLYLEQGQAQPLVDSYLQNNYGDAEDEEAMGRLEQEVAHAKKGFTDTVTQLQARVEHEAKERAEARAKEIQSERTAIEKALDEGFFGIKLSKKETADMVKAMYEADSFEIVQTPEGSQRVPVTKETKAWREILQTPQKRALLSYIVLNGVENFVSLVNRQTSDNFLKAIGKADAQGVPAPPAEPATLEDRVASRRGAQSYVIPTDF